MLRLYPDAISKLYERGYIVPDSTETSPRTSLEIHIKDYFDHKFNDPSLIKNVDNVDFNNKDIDNVGWVKVNKWPKDEEHLTPKLYVDNAMQDIKSAIVNLHELNRNKRDLSSVFKDQDNEFDNKKLTN